MHVLWCIHDLLAYGLIFGQDTKRNKRCPCRPNRFSHHAPKLGKMIYDFHCRWLRSNHSYQSNTHDFNGKTKRRQTPLMMTPPPLPMVIGVQVLEHPNLYETWKVNGGQKEQNPCANIRVKRMTIFFDLPYQKFCILKFFLPSIINLKVIKPLCLKFL